VSASSYNGLSRRTFLGVLAAAPTAWAFQEPVKFSTSVDVVNVLASVRDKKGHIITDLTKEDFEIEEDKRPQDIKYFSSQADLPLTLGLLVDTSGSVRRVIDQERNASRKFLWQVVRENHDTAFVIHFDYQVELLQDLTSSPKELDQALQELDMSLPPGIRRHRRITFPGNGVPGDPDPPPVIRGGTELYDAVMLASEEIMAKQEGRKAIILLTDGIDEGSLVSLKRAIEAAQRADTIVYAIRFVDPSFYGGPVAFGSQNDGKHVLQRMAKQTGGGYYDVGGKHPLDKVYAQIEEELRNQYNLGFTPDSTGSGYRKLRVKVKRKGLVVQARDGYYPAGSKDESSRSSR
jgi:VWFA-related protein